MQPLISIVIPVYNAERYINKCIDSVLSQSYANWELLLIDDGSSDDSGRICDGYSKKDDRIRTFHKRNGGVGSARNVGIEQASGDFITFIDSDDWISSQYIADFVRCNPQRKSIVVSGLITKTPSEEYVSFQYADESTLNEVTARDLIVRYNLFHIFGRHSAAVGILLQLLCVDRSDREIVGVGQHQAAQRLAGVDHPVL